MIERNSGILLHITSLPGNEGVGTLGKNAFQFVDFLRDTGQKIWQILRLWPIGAGDSPYQCLSAFAGNPILIDLHLLVEVGILGKSTLKQIARFNLKRFYFKN